MKHFILEKRRDFRIVEDRRHEEQGILIHGSVDLPTCLVLPSSERLEVLKCHSLCRTNVVFARNLLFD